MAGQRGRRVYATRAWGSLRAACWAAAGGLCADCGGFGFEAHHVVQISRGGPELPDLSGVEWLCRRCHFERHGSRRRSGWDALLDRLRRDTNSG